MGLPGINIVFTKIAAKAIQQGSVGVLALVLKDQMGLLDEVNHFKIKDITDVPESLSDANKSFLEQALKGIPKEIHAIVISSAAIDYTVALNYLETLRFNVMAIPGIESEDVSVISTWVKAQRGNKKRFLAVLPNIVADAESIINFDTNNIKVGENTYTASEYSARMAGVIAGLPLTVAPTYHVFSEVDDVPHLTKSEADAAVDAGRLILYHDGEKVKIARGVTSLTTTTTEPEEFKKIKLMRIYDKVADDIERTIEDKYVGKVQNSYQSKILLIAAINGYLERLELDDILDAGKNVASINYERQKNYLKSIGVDVDNMTEQEILEANTSSKVFLRIQIKALDAIEDVDIEIEI